MSAPRVAMTGALLCPVDELDHLTYFVGVLVARALAADSLARVQNCAVSVPVVALVRLECFEERARTWLDVQTAQLPPHVCAALPTIQAAIDSQIAQLHSA